MNQTNSQRAVKLMFTPEQIDEQARIITDLESNTADIVFEGSLLEAKAYLAGIEQLPDRSLH